MSDKQQTKLLYAVGVIFFATVFGRMAYKKWFDKPSPDKTVNDVVKTTKDK